MTRMRRMLGVTFIALGLTLVQFVAYLLYGTSAQTNASQARLATVMASRLSDAFASGQGAPPVTVLPPAGADGLIAWGELVIPKIGLDKIVVEGSGRDELKAGPGHYVETPLPGDPGAVGIAGHRTTWGAPFHRLDLLEPGDEIVIVTAAGRYVYGVTRSRIVRPEESEVLAGDPRSTAEHRLVLTTCHPKYSAAQRLIVFADLISWEVAA
jgi:sortase A